MKAKEEKNVFKSKIIIIEKGVGEKDIHNCICCGGSFVVIR